MKRPPYLLLILLLASVCCCAIPYTGKVIFAETGKPIAYANIGVPGGTVGTTANEDGTFTLLLDSVREDDKLLISCIGYESMLLKVGDLNTKYRGGKPIMLHEQPGELKEVTVRPVKRRHGLLSTNRLRYSVVPGGIDTVVYGKEAGVLLHLNKRKRPAYLDSVQINISFCNHDTVFLRLNVYEKANDSFINIQREPIYMTVPVARHGENVLRLDLSGYGITVKQDFIISVEYVRDLKGKDDMYFCGSLFSLNCYGRRTSQGSWTFNPAIGMGVSAYVSY